MVTLVTITGIAILHESTAVNPSDVPFPIPPRIRELARLNPELLPLVLALIQKASLADSVHPLTSHDIEKVLAENAPNITLDSEEVDELAKDVLLNRMQKKEDVEQLENDTQDLGKAPEIYASKSQEKGKIDLTFVLHNKLSPEISIKTLERKIEQLIQESLKVEKQPPAPQAKDVAVLPNAIENPLVQQKAVLETKPEEKKTPDHHSQQVKSHSYRKNKLKKKKNQHSLLIVMQ